MEAFYIKFKEMVEKKRAFGYSHSLRLIDAVHSKNGPFSSWAELGYREIL